MVWRWEDGTHVRVVIEDNRGSVLVDRVRAIAKGRLVEEWHERIDRVNLSPNKFVDAEFVGYAAGVMWRRWVIDRKMAGEIPLPEGYRFPGALLVSHARQASFPFAAEDGSSTGNGTAG